MAACLERENFMSTTTVLRRLTRSQSGHGTTLRSSSVEASAKQASTVRPRGTKRRVADDQNLEGDSDESDTPLKHDEIVDSSRRSSLRSLRSKKSPLVDTTNERNDKTEQEYEDEEGEGEEGTREEVPWKRSRNESNGGQEKSGDERAVRSALLKSIERGTQSSVVSLFFSTSDEALASAPPLQGTSLSKRKILLLEAIRGFHKGQARKFFDSLKETLRRIIESQEYFTLPTSDRNGIGEDKDEVQKEALRFMMVCAWGVDSHLDGLQRRSKGLKTEVMEPVFAVADLLHSQIYELQQVGGADTAGTRKLATQLQSTIMSLCEKWWRQRCINAELLVPQLVPLLLARSLEEQDHPANLHAIKRIFSIRDTLHLFDFEETETIVYLKSLILRTTSSPVYLKVAEGRRLISHFFQVHPTLVAELHRSIRAQILPDTRKTILEAYGEIYFRAWKSAATDTESHIANHDDENAARVSVAMEEHVLQDLVIRALRARNPSMAKACRCLLGQFHENKKTPEVESLLYRLYGPILWRSLSAPNPLLRSNALALLVDTFPLRNPVATPSHCCIQESIDQLQILLLDDVADVRRSASEATCRIMASWWDVLKSQHIRDLLNVIITKHLSDAKSALVRATAVSSLSLLLAAEQSHGVLRPLLPLVGNLLHDKAQRVRLAAAKMLLRIKQIPTIKYYHIVPVDHLLSQLAAETTSRSPVASALTELLLNSFCPQGVSGEEQVRRSLRLLELRPDASRVFFRHVSKHLSINGVCKLIVLFFKCIESATSETSDEEETPFRLANLPLMASFMDAISAMWESIESPLAKPSNVDCRNFLHVHFGGDVLPQLCGHFRDIDGCSENDDVLRLQGVISQSLLECYARLPDEVAGYSKALLSLSKDDVEDRFLPARVSVLCQRGRTQQVIQWISDSISGGMGVASTEESHQQSRRRRSSKRKISLNDAAKKGDDEPNRAVSALESILAGTDLKMVETRNMIITSEGSGVLTSVLGKSLEAAEGLLRMTLDDARPDDCELVLRAFNLNLKLTLHKEAVRSDSAIEINDDARNQLKWLTETVASRLEAPKTLAVMNTSLRSPLGHLDISRISSGRRSSSSLSTPPYSPSGPPPRRKTNRNATPTRIADPDLTLNLDCHATTTQLQLAVSLLFAGIAAFSEWISLGCDGIDAIAEHAQQWCATIRSRDCNDTCSSLLFPSLCRISLLLARRGEQNALREILRTKVNEAQARTAQECMTVVLISSDRRSKVTTVNGEVVKLIVSIVVEMLTEPKDDLVGEPKDFWGLLETGENPEAGELMVILAIRCLLENTLGSVALAQEIKTSLTRCEEIKQLLHVIHAKHSDSKEITGLLGQSLTYDEGER